MKLIWIDQNTVCKRWKENGYSYILIRLNWQDLMIDWICRATEVKHKNRFLKQTKKKKCALKEPYSGLGLHDCEQMGKSLIQ